MPAGAEVTVPVPAPARVTVRGKLTVEKLAVTALAAVIWTVQVAAVPEHAPPQT